jgi:predicted CXXCH cytochrome family protein
VGLHDRGNRGRFGPEGDALCLECHEGRRPGASFQGAERYALSDHATSPASAWPGQAGRQGPRSGQCVTCHDPHGAQDDAGLIPSLLRARPAALCLTCHDGSPASDVASALTRTWRHPLSDEVPGGASAAGVGSAPSSPNPTTALGKVPGTGTCAACHDPHLARRDPSSANAALPGALLGVPRVRVRNGAAGTPPLFTLLPPDDSSAGAEYEVCLRCHSGFARRPPKLLDLGLLLNPANASFHPVEARGRNTRIDRRAFTPGWSEDRQVRCADCHGSDDDRIAGPHGSSFEHILRARSPAPTAGQVVEERDLCFDCHAFATYGPSGAAADASRFPGHASHAARGWSGAACHDPHGSAALPALLVLRSPGLRAFAAEPTGGTCTTTCHATTPTVAAYKARYGR